MKANRLLSPNLSGLITRRLTPEEAGFFVQFYIKETGLEHTIENFNWQYLNLPEKSSWIFVVEPTEPNLKEENIFSAVYCIIPRRFLIDEKIIIGSLSLQTLTGKNYRKLGLFYHLAKTCYEHASNEGVKFVYGSPNDYSMPGLLKHLDWHQLTDPEILVSVKPIKYFLGKLGFRSKTQKSAINIHELHDYTTSLNKLWDKFSKLIKIGAVRDAAFWYWRYLQKPNSSDRVFIINNEKGDIVASCAIGKEIKKEGKRGYILDFMFDPQSPAESKVLLDWCTNLLSSEGCLLVITCVSLGNPYRDLLNSCRYFKLPHRFHKGGPRLALAIMNDSYKSKLHSSDDWHVTHGDYDVV